CPWPRTAEKRRAPLCRSGWSVPPAACDDAWDRSPRPVPGWCRPYRRVAEQARTVVECRPDRAGSGESTAPWRTCHRPGTLEPHRRRGQELASAEGVGVAFAPVTVGSGGDSGDVLDVVGDESTAAGADQLVQAFHYVRQLGRSSSLNSSLGELMRS